MTNNPLPSGVERESTGWLIEETWSGYVHYVHRDFDEQSWRAERDSLARLPFVWVFNNTGGATLTHRVETVPFITKFDAEALRFSTKADAEAWIKAQPSWLNHSDQFQAREHMWLLTALDTPNDPS